MGMICEVAVTGSGDWDVHGGNPDILRFPTWERTAEGQRISLEKSWHGLHYLLCGSAWEGEGPLAFLLAGGQPLGDEDESSVRTFSAEETQEIHAALARVSDEALWSRFDPEQMEQAQVYPQIWAEDEQDLREEYLSYFHELKQLVAAAAQSEQGLVVSIE